MTIKRQSSANNHRPVLCPTWQKDTGAFLGVYAATANAAPLIKRHVGCKDGGEAFSGGK